MSRMVKKMVRKPGSGIKLSVIIGILNSHEMVRRYLLHLKKMDLPDDVEIIFMDDGSDPPLLFPDHGVKNLTIYPTNDFRPWTSCLARNRGAKLAKGDYYLMTDIDHILVQESIIDARNFTGDRMGFIREFGVLDENGNFTQDVDTLFKYGLDRERVKVKGLRAPAHGNSFVLRKELFWKIGGYNDYDVQRYPPMDETNFRGKFRLLQHSGKATTSEYRPKIYLVPNGHYCGDPDYNPFGLFHDLSRKDWDFSRRFAAKQKQETLIKLQKQIDDGVI